MKPLQFKQSVYIKSQSISLYLKGLKGVFHKVHTLRILNSTPPPLQAYNFYGRTHRENTLG